MQTLPASMHRFSCSLGLFLCLVSAAAPARAGSPRKTAKGRREPEVAAGEAPGPGKEGAPAAGRKAAPVTLTVVGNRLIIRSDDPEALALAQQLAAVLTASSNTPGGFAVLKLENADATEAAKVLEEVFNGKPVPPNPLAGLPFIRRLQSARPAVPANPDENRVRIVADPASNSLLVRASPLDLLTIRELLAKAIDVGDTDSQAVMHSGVVSPLKYARATEVAAVLRAVFREQLDNNPLPGGTGRRAGRRTPNLNVDANGQPRGVTLAIGVDDRTNSLVLNCSAKTRAAVEELVRQLDQAAKGATRSVQVVRVKGIDPALVQEAIEAIQGRRAATTGRPAGANAPLSSGRGSGGR